MKQMLKKYSHLDYKTNLWLKKDCETQKSFQQRVRTLWARSLEKIKAKKVVQFTDADCSMFYKDTKENTI